MDLDSLDPEVRELAFQLSDHIFREGVEGIHYMERARTWAENNSADITARRISRELRKL